MNQHADKSGLRGWRAVIVLAVVTLVMSASELLTKYGADHPPAAGFFVNLGLPEWGSPWTWAGTLVAIGAFGLWLWALRTVPLALAYNLTTATYALVPIGAWLFLREHITPLRWLGIALVLAGVLLLVPGMVEVEQDPPSGDAP